jgi:hypothetical protein
MDGEMNSQIAREQELGHLRARIEQENTDRASIIVLHGSVWERRKTGI